jgi:hypothetical protein
MSPALPRDRFGHIGVAVAPQMRNPNGSSWTVDASETGRNAWVLLLSILQVTTTLFRCAGEEKGRGVGSDHRRRRYS